MNKLEPKELTPWTKLTAVMAEKKMKGKQLAELTGLNVMTISYLKSGKRQPSMETLKKIAAALGVEVNEII